mmetsp:Transcript_21051/g.54465  ORF Transcript_21051/g.54465 Transcript_21051/m.54465 type:complete len:409 (-) Transcript_21051:6562-7788(-)
MGRRLAKGKGGGSPVLRGTVPSLGVGERSQGMVLFFPISASRYQGTEEMLTFVFRERGVPFLLASHLPQSRERTGERRRRLQRHRRWFVSLFWSVASAAHRRPLFREGRRREGASPPSFRANAHLVNRHVIIQKMRESKKSPHQPSFSVSNHRRQTEVTGGREFHSRQRPSRLSGTRVWETECPRGGRGERDIQSFSRNGLDILKVLKVLKVLHHVVFQEALDPLVFSLVPSPPLMEHFQGEHPIRVRPSGGVEHTHVHLQTVPVLLPVQNRGRREERMLANFFDELSQLLVGIEVHPVQHVRSHASGQDEGEGGKLGFPRVRKGGRSPHERPFLPSFAVVHRLLDFLPQALGMRSHGKLDRPANGLWMFRRPPRFLLGGGERGGKRGNIYPRPFVCVLGVSIDRSRT